MDCDMSLKPSTGTMGVQGDKELGVQGDKEFLDLGIMEDLMEKRACELDL